MDPILISVSDAGKALGVGRSKIYELIGMGAIETVAIGRRRLVRVASIKSLAETPGTGKQ